MKPYKQIKIQNTVSEVHMRGISLLKYVELKYIYIYVK